MDLSALAALLPKEDKEWETLTLSPAFTEMTSLMKQLQGTEQPEEHQEEVTDRLPSCPVLTSPALIVSQDLDKLHAQLDAAIQQEEQLYNNIQEEDTEENTQREQVTEPHRDAHKETQSTLMPLSAGMFNSSQSDPFASLSSSRIRHWSSLSHWKYASPSVEASPLSSSVSVPVSRKKHLRKKPLVQIDFFSPPPSASVLQPASKKYLSKLNLSQRTIDKYQTEKHKLIMTTRGEDGDKTRKLLQTLFTRPEVIAHIKGTQTESTLHPFRQRVSTAFTPLDQDGEHDHHHDAEQLSDQQDEDSSSPFPSESVLVPAAVADSAASGGSESLSAPVVSYSLLPSVSLFAISDSLSYARHAKKVDVSALKCGLWANIQGITRSNDRDQNRAPPDTCSFQQAIQALSVPQRITLRSSVSLSLAHCCCLLLLLLFRSSSYPVSALSSVSVPYCFICVLHLCNEHELSLERNGIVEVDAADQRAEIPAAERAYDLHDFFIRSSLVTND